VRLLTIIPNNLFNYYSFELYFEEYTMNTSINTGELINEIHLVSSEQPMIMGQYEVKAKQIINADITSAWQVLADFYDVYTWVPGVSKSYALNDFPLGVGAARYCKLDDFGSIEEHITHWVDQIGFVYTISPLGPLNNAVSRWWLTPLANKQTLLEVTLKYDIRFGVFGKMMHRIIMRNKLEKSLPDTLFAVKRKVEANANRCN